MRRSRNPVIKAARRRVQRRRRAHPASPVPTPAFALCVIFDLNRWRRSAGKRISRVRDKGRILAGRCQSRAACLASTGLSYARLAGLAVMHFGRFVLTRSIRFCRATWNNTRLILAATSEGLGRNAGRIWSAVNREVGLPSWVDAAFYRVAVTLFGLVVLVVGGIGVWHSGLEEPAPPGPVSVVVRDHHPPRIDHPGRQAMRGTPAAPIPVKPQQTPSQTQSHDVPRGNDIDSENWFDSAALAESDELPASVFTVGPRARKRPDIPPEIVAKGIPIEPEPPLGRAIQSRPQWLANAVKTPRATNHPMIAIVIDDAGVAQEHTRRASELPSPLTIAFIPYSHNLDRQTRFARERGHELLLHMPMEPSDPEIDPGRNALLTSLGREEIMRRFRWALDRFDGYVGVNNHMGSKFMARPDLVRPVLEELNQRGLLFLDSRTDHRTVGTILARNMAMPHATRNVFLDNVLDPDAVRRQLAEVERVARHSGHAIAIGHPHDVTVEVLSKWIPEARRKGFALVPVSTIVKKEYETQLASAPAGGETDSFLGSTQ